MTAMASVDAAAPMLLVRSFGQTDPGRIRASNQDQFLVAELARAMRVRQSSLTQTARTEYGEDRGHLLVVADGMGGFAGGEQASALTVGSIEDFALNTLTWFLHHPSGEGQNVLADFQTALREADMRVFEAAASHPELRGMGTTLTLAFVLGTNLFVIHVGASRCYLLRNGGLHQLTHDQTVAQELVSHGIMSSTIAATHQYSHVITNSIGGASQGVVAEVHKLAIGGGDVLLLCSDGLTKMIPDARIAEILQTALDPAAACKQLIGEANKAGGGDNITVIVADIKAFAL